MSTTDILLVHPLLLSRDPAEARLMEPYFPLGLLYIAAVLRERGLRVEVFDATFAADEREFARVLAWLSPRYVGLTALNVTRNRARSLARLAREAGALTIVGGPDPTIRPADYLGEHGGEIVVVGEGEETVVELWDLLEAHGGRRPPSEALGEIRGLAFLDQASGRLVKTPGRPAIADLDRVPFPARDLIDVERYRRAWRSRHDYFALSILTSRGCPFGCNWCAKPVFGRLYRQRSPENVVAEMVAIQRDFRPDRLRVLDDVFPLDRKWLRAWHAAVRNRRAAIPFECLSRVDLVDVETLRLLADAGCRKVCYGAESGSQRVLDAMEKGARVEEAYAAAAAMREVGLETYFFIMLGYPGEEWPDIERTRRLLRDTLPEQLSVSVAYPLPGTKFYEQVRDRLTDRPDWTHASENALLFRRSFSTVFYRMVERLLHREVEVGRARRGLDRVLPLLRARIEIELLAVRSLVRILRFGAGLRGGLHPVTT